MSSTAYQSALVSDRERERLVAIGARAVMPGLVRVRVAAIRAYRSGGNVAGAILSGIDAAIRPVVHDAMLAAYMRGRLRSFLNAETAMGRTLALANPYASAVKLLQGRLNLTDDALAAISAEYGRQAASVTGELGSMVERKVSEAIAQATADNLHTRAGTLRVREAFDAAGITPANDFVPQTLFRTQTQFAYSAARWQANQEAAIDDILWGYEYVAIDDDRTTPLCADLNGTRRRKNDPFWSRYQPPNHWNCRSTTIEIYTGDREARTTTIPAVDAPQEGFNFNPGAVVPELVGV